MRYLRTVERPANATLAKLAEMRWGFDYARDPITYATTFIGRVTQQGNVITVYSRSGRDVLTRYQLLKAPGSTLCAPEREAYELLREL